MQILIDSDDIHPSPPQLCIYLNSEIGLTSVIPHMFGCYKKNIEGNFI